MAGSEWTRELKLLEDPETHAWLERAANRMVGELLAEGRFDLFPTGAATQDDSQFADRLIRCELGLIADGVYPIRVALRVALLRVAHDVLETTVSIHPRICSSGSWDLRRMGVSIRPGAMALTVMPIGPNSWASALLKPMMPALAAE